MRCNLNESFFVGSRGNLANYVLPFQIPKPPKKVLKGENKGGTPLLILARPLWSYLPNIQVGVGKYAHTQCPIRTGHLTTLSNQNCWANIHTQESAVWGYSPNHCNNINPTSMLEWGNKPKLQTNQSWRANYLTSWVNLHKVGWIWSRIYTCWNVFLNYGRILNTL